MMVKVQKNDESQSHDDEKTLLIQDNIDSTYMKIGGVGRF